MTAIERKLARYLRWQVDAAFEPGFSQRVLARIDAARSFYFELRQSFVRLTAAAVLVIAGFAFANVHVAADDAALAWPAALGMPSADLGTVVDVASGAGDFT
jgi:hypothetical protein